MQTTITTLLPAPRTLNRRWITPRKTTSDRKGKTTAAITTAIPFPKSNSRHVGYDPSKRHESAEEEVQIVKEAKGIVIGMVILVAACAISAVIARAYFAQS